MTTYLLFDIPQGTTSISLPLLGPAQNVGQVGPPLETSSTVLISTKLLTPRSDPQFCPLFWVIWAVPLISPTYVNLSMFKTKSILLKKQKTKKLKHPFALRPIHLYSSVVVNGSLNNSHIGLKL